MNDEQVLKDFIATAQANNYNYDVVMPKFPELEGYDLQVLKDYIATAEANDYNYEVINPKFPELFDDKKKDDTESVSEVGSLEPERRRNGVYRLDGFDGSRREERGYPNPIPQGPKQRHVEPRGLDGAGRHGGIQHRP